MLDWSKLTDAYGPATEVPRLLAALDPDPAADVWGELTARLCHQGSINSASYPALPYLLAAAEQWPPSARVTPLCLAASILASQDVVAEVRAKYGATHAALLQLTAETVDASSLSQEDIIWLQQAYLLLSGERVWGPGWDRVLEGELTGGCPACGEDLYLVIGDADCFTTREDWINGKETARAAIVAAAPELLPWPGDWLLDTAKRHGDPLLQRRVLHAFGTSACPCCGAPFALGDALSSG